jgi:uncharacterized membrane protein
MTEKSSNSKAQEKQVPQANKPDEQQLKTISAVGYLGILFLVPFLMFPKEKFAVFHANQGLILLIAAVGLNILMPVLGTVTFGLGFLLYPLIWIAIVALLVVGILNAVNGRMKRLPLIGGFNILKVQE